MTQPDAPGSVIAWHSLDRRLKAALHELATSRAAVASLRQQHAADVGTIAALSDRLAAAQAQVVDLRQRLDHGAANTATVSSTLFAVQQACEMQTAMPPPPVPLSRLRRAMQHVPGWSIARAVARYVRRLN